MVDKAKSPSNYALVVLSEGAQWEGYDLREVGEPDAFGHKKKESIGEALSNEIHKATHEETVVSDLTYDLRSGSPDFIDKLVASTFAGMAVDCIKDHKHGVMMGIREGCYAAVPIPDPKLGPRKVDVASMYNVDRFRPYYADKMGLPIFSHESLI